MAHRQGDITPHLNNVKIMKDLKGNLAVDLANTVRDYQENFFAK